MKKFLLYNQGSSYNHGCEAIVRTISGILSRRYPDAEFDVSSLAPEDDKVLIGDDGKKFNFFLSDKLCKIPESKRIFYMGAFSTVFHFIPFFRFLFKDTIKSAKSSDLMVSVGGDNYSYGKSMGLTCVDNYLRRYCKKSVLWGCSINPELLDKEEHAYKIKGLRDFTLITARETLTYEALLSLGLDNVKLYPDPAFTLPVGEVKEPMFDNERDIVGINMSPLLSDFEASGSIAHKNYVHLVRRLLDETDFNIALISHVRVPTTDDSRAARTLLKEFEDTDRIKIFDEGTAIDIKGYISKCRFFIAARTHASIAAYSQCIPTLVVGYSVKSKGIARDLFGTYDGYVVSVQDLTDETSLSDAFFENIVKNEDEIRSHLKSIMPDYKAAAESAGDEIVRLLGEN